MRLGQARQGEACPKAPPQEMEERMCGQVIVQQGRCLMKPTMSPVPANDNKGASPDLLPLLPLVDLLARQAVQERATLRAANDNVASANSRPHA